MNNLKPKEPLLAAMLGVMVTGLGQIYAGKIKRGILLFLIPLFSAITFIFYVINPHTTTSLILCVILVIAGFSYEIFTIVDAYRYAKRYNFSNNLKRTITGGKKVWLIIGIIFFGFILNPSSMVAKNIALYIRQNVVQAFKIPTKTMSPTLLKGDLILTDKAIYQKEAPKRGDIIVFIYPGDTKKMLVKRLVGLPGETIEIKNGSLLINGLVADEPPFTDKFYYNRGNYTKEGQLVKIPTDNYFVLGDNSASSQDSRYFGFVPKKYLIGKAYKIYYPFGRSGPIK
jgi:signal peptidase I